MKINKQLFGIINLSIFQSKKIIKSQIFLYWIFQDLVEKNCETGYDNTKFWNIWIIKKLFWTLTNCITHFIVNTYILWIDFFLYFSHISIGLLTIFFPSMCITTKFIGPILEIDYTKVKNR